MRAGRLIAIFAISGAATLASSGAANAAFDDCASNRVCLWGNDNYVWLLTARGPGYGLLALPNDDRNNQMNSWGNRTTTNARGYDSSTGTGDCQTFSRGGKDSNVAVWNDDEVSSTATNGGC